jgi:hypothetical protein
MNDMGISQFKSHAAEVLIRLAKTQENIIITTMRIRLPNRVN